MAALSTAQAPETKKNIAKRDRTSANRFIISSILKATVTCLSICFQASGQ
jgi:hypothetical protein